MCEPDAEEPGEEVSGRPATLLDELLARSRPQVLRVQEARPPVAPVRPVLMVHAGAGQRLPGCRAEELRATRAAAASAYQLLVAGADGLTAVQHAIARLESFHWSRAKCGCLCDSDSPQFEVDAAILEENNLKLGCVGGVRNFKHPIVLAKYVMKRTDQNLVLGEEAESLVEKLKDDEKQLDEEDLLSEQSFEDNSLDMHTCPLEKCPVKGASSTTDTQSTSSSTPAATVSSETSSSQDNDDKSFEVRSFGAAAYDLRGRLSCGTVVFRGPEAFGRLSASGTVGGCAIAADEEGCACVSGPESLLYLHAPALALVRALDDPGGPKRALQAHLDQLRCRGGLGALAIDARGSPHVYSNAASFPWASCIDSKIFFGCAAGELRCDKLPTIRFAD